MTDFANHAQIAAAEEQEQDCTTVAAMVVPAGGVAHGV
jgi:hypothetical protein